jgi:uncharacterized protein YdeI (YjbR/CyaY-like superfamily)
MSKKIIKLNKKELNLTIPPDLSKSLADHPKARAQWIILTPLAQRDFITWINGAKQPETRKRRIEKTWSVLTAGKRRPCCYSIIPVNFYKVLRVYPKAKAQWGNLTSTERRDLVEWIETANNSIENNKRMEKACALLVAGKRRHM